MKEKYINKIIDQDLVFIRFQFGTIIDHIQELAEIYVDIDDPIMVKKLDEAHEKLDGCWSSIYNLRKEK